MLQSKFFSWSGALCLSAAACATISPTRPQPSAAPNASPGSVVVVVDVDVVEPVQQPSAAAVAEPPIAETEGVVQSQEESTTTTTTTTTTELTASDPYFDEVSEQGQRARGLYFSAPVARRLGTEGIIRQLRGARLDAAVIDVKDDAGRISFATTIPELAASRHVFLRDAPAFLRELKTAGIYTIARVVCFNDPVLPKLHPDRAVIDTRGRHAGNVWNLHKGRNTWLDPYNERNHDLLIALVREIQTLGFDEIQLDYIRFPVDEGTKFATFPAQGDKPRREVLLGLLRRMDEALSIPLGVDVFGLTTFREGDPAGLGQSLEDWAAHVEVFSPMLYVNGMKTWLSNKTQQRAGLLVEAGVRNLRERVGPKPVIRPFLQGFESGADYYDTEFVAEQVRGARAGGGDGFLFWNPGSSYRMVREGLVRGATGEIPFRIEERSAARRERKLEEQAEVAPTAQQAAAASGEVEPASHQGS